MNKNMRPSPDFIIKSSTHSKLYSQKFQEPPCAPLWTPATVHLCPIPHLFELQPSILNLSIYF